MAYFGNAALTWSATSDAGTQRVHLLNAPIRNLRPAQDVASYLVQSLDRTKREAFTVGAGVTDLIGEIRYDGGGQGLADVMKAAGQNLTVTYYPNLADAGTAYACQVLAPVPPADGALDTQRGLFGEQQLTVRLRRIGNVPWGGLFKASDVLFSYRAGGDLSQATFTRATSTAAPATYAAGPGYGALSTAKTNVARIHWVANPSSMGPRAIPTLLLEDTATNVMRDSENFGTVNWTITAGLTRSSGKPDPKGGTKAWRLTASTSAGSRLSQQQTVPSSGQQAVSIWLGPSTNPSTGHVIAVTSSGAKRLDLKVSWSSGIPTVTALTGKRFAAPEEWQNNMYRVTGITASSAPFASGKKITKQLFPTSTAASASKGTLAVYGAQVE